MLKKWWWWLVWGSLLVASTVATVIYGLLFMSDQTQIIYRRVVDETGTETVEEVAVDPLRPVHILVLGYGGGTHAGGLLTDTIMVAQVRPRERQINLFSLPRDLWVRLPITESATSDRPLYGKLNRAFAIGQSQTMYPWREERFTGDDGGGQLASETISEIIGQPIDYYVAVDFAGFMRTVELIAGQDGLAIDVPYSFVDEFYPIEGREDDPCGKSEEEIAQLTAELSGYELEQQFACRYERLEFHAGSQLIPAEELLKFVRSRHSGTHGGDFGRSQRQQVVIEAVKDKIFALSFLPKVPALAASLFKVVKTNADLELINNVLANYDDVRTFQVNSQVIDNKTLLTDGRSSDGQYILRPRAGQDDYSEIQALVKTSLEASGSGDLADEG